MNADVEKAVEYMRDVLTFGADRTKAEFERMAQALRDQEAEIAGHVQMLADCFRMSGADPDGDDDRRLADYALRAVTDLRRDYDDVLDWQDRAEKAEALLRECLTFLQEMHVMDADWTIKESQTIHTRITAHLGAEQ